MKDAKGFLGWTPRTWVIAVLAALVLGWAFVGGMRGWGQETVTGADSGPLEPLIGQPLQMPGPSDPLLREGEVLPLDQAASMVDYPILIPSDAMASRASLSEVWVQPETRETALRFSTGIRIYLAKWPTGKDAGSSLNQQVEDSGAGWIQEISGNPAWVLPKDAQDKEYPPQSNLTIVVGGVEVNIWGDVSTDELIRIASTLT